MSILNKIKKSQLKQIIKEEMETVLKESMSSEHYRTILNNEYKNKELSLEDFDNTLMWFAELYHREKSV